MVPALGRVVGLLGAAAAGRPVDHLGAGGGRGDAPGKFAVYSAAGSGLFATGVAALVVAGLDAMPSQLVFDWFGSAFDRGLTYTFANPVPSVAVAGMALFAVLATRNAYSRWLSTR